MRSRFVSEDPIGLAGATNPYSYVAGNPLRFIDPEGLGPKDRWYGHNEKDFHDWVHQLKEDEKRAPTENYTKDQVDRLKEEWTKTGKPRGRGGESGKGGRLRSGGRGKGGGLRCNWILTLIGITLDAIEAYMEYQECQKDPCQCVADCS